MKKSKHIYRGINCKAEIISGGKELRTALYHGRRLYNHVWWFVFGYNKKLRKIRFRNWQRGCGSINGLYSGNYKEKFPSKIDLWYEFYLDDQYKLLSDATAMSILTEFAGSIQTWLTNRKENPELNPQPPNYSKELRPISFRPKKNAKYLGNNRWKLTALSGATKNRHVFIDLYLPPFLKDNLENIAAIKCLSDKRWTVSYKIIPKINDDNGVAGIDLGINRIATIAFDNGESILYSGSTLLSMQRYYSKKTSQCKPSHFKDDQWDNLKNDNDNKMSKIQKKYWEKYRKEKRLLLDNLTSSIIDECLKRKIKTIVIGDLKGIREEKDFGNSMNQKLHAWPFGKITEMLIYKGEEVGIKIIKISEDYTSITCSICGYINPKNARIKRGLLTCKKCGINIHADVNGAINILNRYLPANKRLEVVARFRGQSSTGTKQGIDKFLSQIYPTFSAKFDLRNYSVIINNC